MNVVRNASNINSSFTMKGVDVEEPWNVIEDPPCGKNKRILPIEGTWRMISHENFDAFLAAVGVTPLVAIMVLRSETMVTIYEDLVRLFKCRNSVIFFIKMG